MNEIKKQQLREIIAESQMRVNQVASGFKVVLIEATRELSDEELVRRALQDRQSAGLDASNDAVATAPLTLDGVSKADRDLIEATLCGLSAVEGLEK